MDAELGPDHLTHYQFHTHQQRRTIGVLFSSYLKSARSKLRSLQWEDTEQKFTYFKGSENHVVLLMQDLSLFKPRNLAFCSIQCHLKLHKNLLCCTDNGLCLFKTMTQVVKIYPDLDTSAHYIIVLNHYHNP